MIKRELARFLVVGVAAVLSDYISYHSLVEFEVMVVDMAKGTGFVIGTLFAYFANRFWTFDHNPHVSGTAWRFVVLYASTLGTNVLSNTVALKLLGDGVTAIQLAFLLATGVSACLNFLGMKFFVFRPSSPSELQ